MYGDNKREYTAKDSTIPPPKSISIAPTPALSSPIQPTPTTNYPLQLRTLSQLYQLQLFPHLNLRDIHPDHRNHQPDTKTLITQNIPPTTDSL